MYNSVLVALVRKNQVGLGMAVLLKLLKGRDSTRVPNLIACNELLVALRKSDLRIELKQVFDKLRVSEGFEMDTWGNGRAEDVYTLFCDLKKKGQFVNGVTYSIVVLGSTRIGGRNRKERLYC
ncbi:hypothetical protein ACFX2J_019353 [Malus domestica]